MFDKTETLKIKVEDMHCGHCVARVETALKALKGVKKASADLETKTVSVDYVPSKINAEAMVEAIKAIGFNPKV